MTQPCVFCGIVEGKVAVSTVYRDDAVMAFMDIRPVNPGHVLVVPLKHEVSLLDLDEETAGRIFGIGMRTAGAIGDSGVRLDGFNLFLADGEAAGQEVFHVHLHVVPRFVGDGFGLRFGPEYGKLPPRAELDEIAGRIRRAAGWE
jgi:histidine triad (HIT) family protein